MKKYFFLLSLTLAFLSCKEKKETPTIKKGYIEVKAKYIKYNSTKPIEVFSRIKSLDNNEIYSYDKFIDSNYKLPYGNYQLEYQSFYLPILRKVKFSVNKKETQVNFYRDSLDYSPIKDSNTYLMIDKLQNNDVIYLYENVSGCFFSTRGKFTIAKRDSSYYISSNNRPSKKLNHQQLQLLREFELEIRSLYLKDGGCTTMVKYLLLNPKTNEFVSAEENSCNYYGMGYLINHIYDE